MSPDAILALAAFAFVASVTPGPSNLILLAAGANFGIRRCVPLIFGLNVGFVAMLLVVGLGLGQVLQANAGVFAALRVLSLLYILWLAWKIARSAPLAEDDASDAREGRPLSFLQMALLQWVNPKAWAVALAVTATYTAPSNFLASLLALAAVFSLVNLPSVSVWAISGSALRRFLSARRTARLFNVGMAALLVVSVVPVLIDFGRTG